ncbi:MAG: DMT family transporter [Peptococcaceae bacterium]|nr:DMT family transporter [Peptococcaceae bacterium]
MDKNKKTGVIARLALLAATLIWGSSFVIMKNTVATIPAHYLLAIRFTAACLLLSLLFYKQLTQINKSYLKEAGLMGLCLFLAYSFQTTGLTGTTPGKNAFLTAVYCVIVPFLYWLADKKRPTLGNLLAAFLCLGGIGLVSLTEALTIGQGDSRTLIGGLFFAAHLVCVTIFSREKNPMLITILQFAYCALFSWLTALFTEGPLPQVGSQELGGLVYLSVCCTAVALFLQNFGQKYVPPAQAALILSLEAVFGVIFSVLIYHETVSLRMFFGFLLIFGSILLSETWPVLQSKLRGIDAAAAAEAGGDDSGA